MKIITVCNYGMVRSVCMAQALQQKGHETCAVGIVNYPIPILDYLFNIADKIIICNKDEINENLINEICENKEERLRLIEKYKNKILVANLGRDRWGDNTNTELYEICKRHIKELNL